MSSTENRFIEETARASERPDGADAIENLLIERRC